MAAAASDKARFYLEQSVPELQTYKEKGIFTAAEISAIAAKRSASEHRINMAGASSPTDYTRYASYEINLDLLRRKRCKRLGVKGTKYVGQKRVFSVLERGTRKFPGDIALWMQYLEFCRSEEANLKLAKGITAALRLHPMRWELWVWAAKYHSEGMADMATARSFMQRGLRFCERKKDMWLQYLRMEMIYLAKIEARKTILLADRAGLREVGDLDGNSDEVALPTITQSELPSGDKDKRLELDDATIQKLSEAPALDGAIPIAIISAAAKTFKYDSLFLDDTFVSIREFSNLPSWKKIAQAIVDAESQGDHYSQQAIVRRHIHEAGVAILGVPVTSPEFPTALYETIQKLRVVPATENGAKDLLHILSIRLFGFVHSPNTDKDIEKVLLSVSKQHIAALPVDTIKGIAEGQLRQDFLTTKFGRTIVQYVDERAESADTG